MEFKAKKLSEEKEERSRKRKEIKKANQTLRVIFLKETKMKKISVKLKMSL